MEARRNWEGGGEKNKANAERPTPNAEYRTVRRSIKVFADDLGTQGKLSADVTQIKWIDGVVWKKQ